MKKNLRYGLIAVLVLVLLVVTAVMASAAGEFELYDDEDNLLGSYDTLTDAFGAAASGDTIKLAGDVSGLSEFTFSSESAMTLTLDGQSNTLTFGENNGFVVGANMTLIVQNLTIDRSADPVFGTLHSAFTVNTAGTDLTLSAVTITTKWCVGVSMGAKANVTVNDYTSIRAFRFCFNLTNASLGGLVTVNGEHTLVEPTKDPASDSTCTFYANGADVVINNGTFYGVKYNTTNGGSFAGGLFATWGCTKASAITINNGTFLSARGGTYTNALFVNWGGKWPSFGEDGDKNWITINNGTFSSAPGASMFFTHYRTDATTYADIVINGGTFSSYADADTKPASLTAEYWSSMFSMGAGSRLTINDGTFTVGGFANFIEVRNQNSTLAPVHNVKGGTINAASLVYVFGSGTNRGSVNFGDPELAGPTVNLTLANIANGGNYGTSGYDYGKGNIFLQSAAAGNGYAVLNFYSGTYNMYNTKPRNYADTADLNYTSTAFIDGEGVPVNFYGGTFNFHRSGPMVYSQDNGYSYSAVNFYANAGGTGGVFNFDSAGGYALRVYSKADRQSVTHTGHMYNDPTHGNKLIINIQAGTFNAGTDGKTLLVITGPAPIINFGAADKPGPTFTFPAGNNSYTYAIELASAAGALDPSFAAVTLSPAILNFYSGTYQMLGDNNGFISANGGTINIEGGTFKVANNNKLINFYDNDGIGNLSISGGTFDLSGSGSILNFSALKAPNNTAGTRLTTGDVAITGGTFKSTGSADGVLFSLNGSYPGSFSISGATFSEMTANARYFSIGQTLPFTPSITSQVFPTDPVKGLGGYTTSAVVGGYQPTATKLFAGGQMVVTNNYELAIFWKLTEAQAENYTKTTVTFDGKSPYDITEKTVSDKYPDGSDVESGYKIVKVVLDHITVRELGYYFRADLYVSGDLIASTDYSALEYLRKVGYATEAARAAKLEADAEADVSEEEKTIGLLSAMTYLAYHTDVYARGSVAVRAAALEGGVSKGNVTWFNDRGFSRDCAYIPAFAAVSETTATWTGSDNTNANLTSVGLRFTNNIQFYVEFTATSLEGISVTYSVGGGAAKAARIVNIAGSTYRAYTTFTNLENLDETVTFTLSGDTNTQTCEYSLDAFVYKYQDSTATNANGRTSLKNVARYLYQFKEAVAAYYPYA